MLTLILSASLQTKAQYDFIRPVKDAIPGGYNFWVYTPTEYYYTLNETPVIIFLHGQSLCGSCLLYTSPSPRDATLSRMPSSA